MLYPHLWQIAPTHPKFETHPYAQNTYSKSRMSKRTAVIKMEVNWQHWQKKGGNVKTIPPYKPVAGHDSQSSDSSEREGEASPAGSATPTHSNANSNSNSNSKTKGVCAMRQGMGSGRGWRRLSY